MILAFLTKYKVYAAIAAAGLLLFGGMWARIHFLEEDRDAITAKLTIAEEHLKVAKGVNSVNTANLALLAGKLNECVEKNKALAQYSKESVENYNKALKEIRDGVEKERQKVRKALEKQTCARTHVPLDVERVLRNAAASAN